ncbi:MAG: pentapeptide repeat-containing protein [Candidatus Aenigmatarchaeota archaeon]
MLRNYLIFALLLFTFETSFAQTNNPIIYPYGGVPNFERKRIRDPYAPIDFNNPIIFPIDIIFNEDAKFLKAHFNELAQFSGVKFAKNADFTSAIFNGKSEFNKAVFKGNANFNNAEFNWLNFSEAFFEDNVVFRNAIIRDTANFSDATFYGAIDFSGAQLLNRANFKNSKFYASINLIGTYFNEAIKFNYVEFYDSVFIGSQRSDYIQSFDFSMADLIDKADQFAFEDERNKNNKNIIKYSGAAIILTSPVDIKIQLEKFKFIHLKENLDYFTKKRIIHRLKENFKDDDYRIERFELDYIFAKSTKYQKESSSYVKKKPIKKAISFFYDYFLGLGYRPFKIIKLMFFFITFFSIIYFISSNIKINIDKYINNILNLKYIKFENISKKQYIKRIEEFLNCYYFSATIFFNIKIRSEILRSFSFKQKIIIIIEWILSLICYYVFIKYSKAGFNFGTWAYTLIGK